ncbi:hypothetical protein G7054_g14249 [Neopestalotiopsis clavispora]|nr:hypothetical protein G7054_g14249 [Neopestalotiopsis clavispora]
MGASSDLFLPEKPGPQQLLNIFQDHFSGGRALRPALISGTLSEAAQEALLQMSELRRGLLQDYPPEVNRRAIEGARLMPGLRELFHRELSQYQIQDTKKSPLVSKSRPISPPPIRRNSADTQPQQSAPTQASDNGAGAIGPTSGRDQQQAVTTVLSSEAVTKYAPQSVPTPLMEVNGPSSSTVSRAPFATSNAAFMAPPNESGLLKRAFNAVFPKDSSDSTSNKTSTSIEGILRDPANQGKKRKYPDGPGWTAVNTMKETRVPVPKLPINPGASDSSSHTTSASGHSQKSSIQSRTAVQPEEPWNQAGVSRGLRGVPSNLSAQYYMHHRTRESSSGHMYTSEEDAESYNDVSDSDDDSDGSSKDDDDVQVVSDIASIQVLRADGGRRYNIWKSSDGREIRTFGALLPSGYQLYEDPVTPWICPIRSCRLLFSRLEGLGGHFNSKHRAVELHDNKDGTFSIERSYSRDGRTPAIVLSKGPLDPLEPEMPEPTLPVSKLGKKGPAQAKNNNTVVKKSSKRRRPSSQVAELNSLAKASTIEHPRIPAESRVVTTWKTLVWPHLQNTPSSPIPSTGYVPSLLPLPIKRSLVFNKDAPVYFERKTQDISALIIQITGAEAPEPCARCSEGRGPFSGCIVVSPDAPVQVRNQVTSCANCFYKGNQSRCSGLVEWHKKRHKEPNQELQETQEITSQAEDVVVDSSVEESTPRRSKRTVKDVVADLGKTATSQSEPDSASEMSEWEIAPGRIRDETAPEKENFMFSTAYMAHGAEVRIDSQAKAYNLSIKPGTTHQVMQDLVPSAPT